MPPLVGAAALLMAGLCVAGCTTPVEPVGIAVASYSTWTSIDRLEHDGSRLNIQCDDAPVHQLQVVVTNSSGAHLDKSAWRLGWSDGRVGAAVHAEERRDGAQWRVDLYACPTTSPRIVSVELRDATDRRLGHDDALDTPTSYSG